jgi:hypothetical protein
MSQHSKRVADSSPDITDQNPQKRAEIDEGLLVISDSDIEIVRRHMEHDDIEPDKILIVVSGKLKDDYINYLRSIRTTVQPTTVQHTVNKANVEVDFQAARIFSDGYYKAIEYLNNIESTFSTQELKENLNDRQSFIKFREVRRNLTDFYTGGDSAIVMINKFNNGEKDYLLKTSKRLIPNRLNRDLIASITDDINATVFAANAKLFNQTIEDCANNVKTARSILQNEDKIIVAKAWRTVKLSNSDITRKIRQNFIPTSRRAFRKPYTDRHASYRSTHQQTMPKQSNVHDSHREYQTSHTHRDDNSNRPVPTHHDTRDEYRQDRDRLRKYSYRHEFPSHRQEYEPKRYRTNNEHYTDRDRKYSQRQKLPSHRQDYESRRYRNQNDRYREHIEYGSNTWDDYDNDWPPLRRDEDDEVFDAPHTYRPTRRGRLN